MGFRIGTRTLIRSSLRVHCMSLRLSFPLSSAVWPNLFSLPELPSLFRELHLLILESETWTRCECSHQEIQSVEKKINAVTLCLEIEKIYAKEYWSNERRIQASVGHYVVLLKYFLEALIVDGHQNILSCIKSKKLCLKPSVLQDFINQMLKLMRAVYQFMTKAEFGQEKVITKQMFSELISMSESLPTLGRQKLLQLPKLIRFISIINPIEARSPTRRETARRRRERTFLTTRHSLQIIPDEKLIRQPQDMLSHINIFTTLPNQLQSPLKPHADHHYFRFPENLRKHSIYISSKKPTITTMHKNSFDLSRGRSPSRYDSPTKGSGKRINTIRKKIQTEGGNSFKDQKHSSSFHRGTNMSAHSNSMHKIAIKKSIIDTNMQTEVERTHAQKKPTKQQTHFHQKNGKLINMQNGKGKGWTVVRQWFWLRLANRRIKKLLNL